MKRVGRWFYGTVRRITPQEGGAIAQCSFCHWGKFFPDRRRLRYTALARASSSLREHVKLRHREMLPHITTAAEWNTLIPQIEERKP